MEQEKLPRRERERLRQRQDILDTALSLFSERGYHNVSMHEIAEKAEFAIGTLYKFFENKEDLYTALVLEKRNVFDTVITKAIETSTDEIEKIRNYAKAKGELFCTNVPFLRLYLAESFGTSFNAKSGLFEDLRNHYYEFIDKLAAIFDSGVKHKRFREITNSKHLAIALDSALNGFLLLRLTSPERLPYEEDLNNVLNVFLGGLIKT